MPFSCFRYKFFYISTKSYHTVARQAPTSFFDSSFNYIKQNSQLVSFESFGQKGRRFPNPHPANSATSHYLQLDNGQCNAAFLQDDESNNNHIDSYHRLKNPINIVLPLNQGHIILSVNSYQLIIQKVPAVDLKQVLDNTNRLTGSVNSKNEIQKRAYHTSAPSKQYRSDKIVELKDSKIVTTTPKEEPQEVLKYYQPSIEDEIPQPEQSPATFLNQQAIQIESAFASGQYEKINSIYMAIKRNDITPSLKLYSLILKSICLRKIDDSLDDKLSILLNVYQDLIQQRLKPNGEIYTTIINELVEASIKSAMTPNVSDSGADFFKIAIDIFSASNCSHVQQYDVALIDKIFVAMNMYPDMVNTTSLVEALMEQKNFVKNSTFYSSLITNCRFTQDSKLAISLYEEFKVESSKNEELHKDQFKIYSSFISTLVATNEVQLATKFLDRILTSIKNYDDYETKITMLLSSYLLSLSKINLSKALEIWSQFNSIGWIPEFSFEFYLNFLEDSLHDYPTCVKLYNYMVALPRDQYPVTVDSYFITPPNPTILSKFLQLAIVENDKSTVLKMVRESFVRGTYFSHESYPQLFQFLNNEDLMVKIINNHGLSTKKPFDFLTHLTQSIPNLPIFSISKTLYFKKLISLYSMQKVENYHGFYVIFSSIFQQLENSSLTLGEVKEYIELCSSLILEFHDVNNYYTEFNSHQTIAFKNELTQFYKRLVLSLDGKNVEELGLSAVALDAIDSL